MSVELLSPAGNFETALAAFAAGADAVYCGLSDFSARAFADNLCIADLKNLLRYARRNGRKVYVTFNTVIDEDSFDDAIEQLALLDEARPDALIVQDLGVARVCRKYFPDLELHASTQIVAHNLEGVLALKELGFKRVVLARELSLAEIASIAKRCGGLELECFIHGALCYSVSGLCLFGAMERGRSGNRGKCPYCCRMAYDNAEGGKTLAFSMRDLRLGEDVRKLVDAGVVSLKIEGRMKSPLYVASVTKYYRQILDGATASDAKRITVGDLETVFSRRTTELYLDGRGKGAVMDPTSLGHVGTEIGTVKKVTKDRDGLRWLRFHTARALEKHDGLQFEAMVDGKHLGMGIAEMRQSISRHPVFEVAAGADVEVLLPSDERGESELAAQLKPGMKIYCSMSNAVKRMFPAPSFRESDYEGDTPIEVAVTLTADAIRAKCGEVEVAIGGVFDAAKNPAKTEDAIRKAFSKLGGTDYRLGKLTVEDKEQRFAPMSALNDLRRDLVERLDEARMKARRAKVEAAQGDQGDEASGFVRIEDNEAGGFVSQSRVKIRMGQKVPPGEWDEVIVAVNAETKALPPEGCRVALPVYTSEPEFNQLRNVVKRLRRAGFDKWEAADLATLRMLRALGVTDITADWTLYAFNARALAELSELGVTRFVASPENGRQNLQYLAESGYDIEFLSQQSTPLFISLTQPLAQSALAVHQRDGLWVTTRPVPRTFDLPTDVSTRLDLSWDP